MSDQDDLTEAVILSIGELLNMAAQVAELQTTDEAAEEIYAMCDLVAAYFEIERAQIEVVENPDGSWTSRIQDPTPKKAYTSGSVRVAGKPKLRLVDNPPNTKDNDQANPDNNPE